MSEFTKPQLREARGGGFLIDLYGISLSKVSCKNRFLTFHLGLTVTVFRWRVSESMESKVGKFDNKTGVHYTVRWAHSTMNTKLTVMKKTQSLHESKQPECRVKHWLIINWATVNSALYYTHHDYQLDQLNFTLNTQQTITTNSTNATLHYTNPTLLLPTRPTRLEITTHGNSNLRYYLDDVKQEGAFEIPIQLQGVIF